MEINPFLAAIKEKEFINSVVQSKFNHFKDLLRETSNIVDFSMQFFLDNNKPKVKGNIKTKVILNCNRCLHALIKDIEVDFDLFLLRDEVEIKKMPKKSDFLIIESDKISIFDIIEEELILALPLVIRHELDDKECTASYSGYTSEKQSAAIPEINVVSTTNSLMNNSKLAELRAALVK